jgi:hypothetical protein
VEARMAMKVRAECVACGIVRIHTDDCTLVRMLGSTDATITTFVCPTCARHCVAPTPPGAALLLAHAGVETRNVARPDELDDPRRHDTAAVSLILLSLRADWYAEVDRL